MRLTASLVAAAAATALTTLIPLALASSASAARPHRLLPRPTTARTGVGTWTSQRPEMSWG
jgi:hypothetical protein